ncbi:MULTISPECIES: PepSY domain-containing protein [unclassified Herbaspirillum]|uniref:PepSY-associated TM helix domain-containing protein n=1 Tax=unclassified Herbaspirillum TaxID=2624150 RepID=UPI001151D7DE|nr:MULTISPECIES: PepSY-associated TM helix domain-containing protein [unclassified Herbaspirillum]MBB5393345.1 putative iron-regulated membrane protein [Herbaspirillum sp. SJZ102]TQK03906.1 putative iron-regulated membrane protein [Herbaspirillum sp. SJZ130]TQK08638.1 putative iron-regulated membrane protein [Herbaspirillum sp. SJZ106]TWC71909.1 putative iron-regulated membrane protein [Herbaspirillum sp. SJZ099]
MTTHTYQPVAGVADQRKSASALAALLLRLHFYIGLFVGPFILVAAVTGTLFVVTPQIEARWYADQLLNRSQGVAQPLAAQVTAAQSYIGEGPRLFAVRPGKEPGWNTRVMFSQEGLGDSESRAVFIDPVSLAVKGDLIVYGTSGTLPFRTALDYLHRNLMLGSLGRNYSELAASWLWLGSLGGLWLWWSARRKARPAARRPMNARRLHALLGLWIVVGLVFFSATGLTWSKWAGGHVNMLRAAMGWVTPSASMQLQSSGAGAGVDADAGMGEHAGHMGHHGQAGMAMPMPAGGDPARFDLVRSIARQGGIDAGEIEIRPPRARNQAWMVREVDRSWPTQVDTVAVDPERMAITSRADFETFPLVAKLIRWGVDAHMGILFGVWNQILMAAFGIALTAMIVLGYVMWWRRRPAAGSALAPLSEAFMRLPPAQRTAVGALAIALGWSLPLMGLSLLLFLLADVLRWHLSRRLARR